MKPRPATLRAVWTATLLLAAIGVAAVLRRALHLLSPDPAQPLDAGFGRYPVLTAIHILAGLAFVVLGPLQFWPALRARRPVMHRWTGRLLVAWGAVIGLTALVMSPRMAIGGANETAATMLFAILFLGALAKAWAAIRRRDIPAHREWMIRAFAIGLAVAFVRPIVGIFFATSRLTHLTPHDFFGIAFWLGFTIQTLAAEAWIQYTRVTSR